MHYLNFYFNKDIYIGPISYLNNEGLDDFQYR